MNYTRSNASRLDIRIIFRSVLKIKLVGSKCKVFLFRIITVKMKGQRINLSYRPSHLLNV